MTKATRAAFGAELAALAKLDNKIVVLDADLAPATKTGDVQKAAPSQFFEAGIAESNMVGMGAGMAASGLKPFVASFAMFLAGRAYEQVRNSVAYPHLNVKLCATHAGITVGEDGGSHQCVEDIALMRVLPGMMVLQPADEKETVAMVRYLASHEGPAYLRLCRAPSTEVYSEPFDYDPMKISCVRHGQDVAFVASGYMVQECLKAADALKKFGIWAAVYDLSCIKPLNVAMLNSIIASFDSVYVAEEHLAAGGIYSAVREVVDQPCKVKSIAVEDRFGQSGGVDALMHEYGLDAESITQRVVKDRLK